MKHKDPDKKSNIPGQHSSGFGLDPSFKLGIEDMDLGESFEILTGHGGVKKLFLQRFNEKELYAIMEKTGIMSHLKKAGFDKLVLDLYVDNNRINYLKLYTGEKIPERQLLDIRVSETTFIPDRRFFKEGTDVTPYEMINIEWLSARNPFRDFDDKKPQLPGQQRPGLGILRFCFDLLHIIAKEIYKDGFLDIPDHMHGAVMYSSKFKFFDPVHEAILRAVIRDLHEYTISDISWGIITGTIIEQYSNKPQIYDPCEQVHFVSRKMKRYFESGKYRETFKKYYNRKKYRFEYNDMLVRRNEILLSKRIEDL